MPNTAWNRKLDLSAAAKAKAKTKSKPDGGLTERQAAIYQRAIAGHKKWLGVMLRAGNAVQKHQDTIRRYEKLLAKKTAD